MTVLRTFIFAALTVGLFTIAYSPVASQEGEATLELHWRDCATQPAEDVSWFEHCHDGPWRMSVNEGETATFTSDSGEEYAAELDGNGDVAMQVPAGTYTFQQPSDQNAEAMHLTCAPVDETGNIGDPIDDPENIAIENGEHFTCDFYAVWGEPEDAAEQVGDDSAPQGTIEFRWRACEEAPENDEWHEECFEEESDHGLEPQEGRVVTLKSAESDEFWTDELNENGNAQFIVSPGEYVLPTMTGDFVTDETLFCSQVNPAGTAEDLDIAIDPLVIEDESHLNCDYYYVAD